MDKGRNVILDKMFDFPIKIIDFSEKLRDLHNFIFAEQILKSGPSVGANIRKAQQAESKADFKHKIKIASKEVSELEYWLQLGKISNKYADPGDSLILNLQEIKIDSKQKIAGKILVSSVIILISLNLLPKFSYLLIY